MYGPSTFVYTKNIIYIYTYIIAQTYLLKEFKSYVKLKRAGLGISQILGADFLGVLPKALSIDTCHKTDTLTDGLSIWTQNSVGCQLSLCLRE